MLGGQSSGTRTDKLTPIPQNPICVWYSTAASHKTLWIGLWKRLAACTYHHGLYRVMMPEQFAVG
jgi:hypothetical protein